MFVLLCQLRGDWLWRAALVGVVGVVGAGSVGCAAKPIHANMTSDVAAGVLKECFEPGMSPDETVTVMDELKIEPRRRRWYAATDERGPVLVGRVTEPGGYWPGSEDSIVEFIDVSLVFDKKLNGEAAGASESAGVLREVRMRRGGIRYFQGDPVVQPAGADGQPRLMGRVGRFPLEPPPPRDPVVETRLVEP